MPVPTIGEDAPGLLLPTPTAASYGSCQGGAAGRTGEVRPSLASLVPTPRKSDSKDQWDAPREGRKNGLDLPGTIYPMLGTPRSSRGYDSDEFSGGAAPNPRKLVYEMLPTPTKHDVATPKTAEQIAAIKARAAPRQSGGPPGISNLNERLAMMIPTPMGGSRTERGGTPMDASAWARERMTQLMQGGGLDADSHETRHEIGQGEPGDNGAQLPPALRDIGRAWSHWNGGLAGLAASCAAAGFGRMDDGLSAGMDPPACAPASRNAAIAAYGDAILPQISEAIGRVMAQMIGNSPP